MRKIICKKCKGEIPVKFFNSQKFTCPDCKTMVNFRDFKAYRIISITIEILALALLSVFTMAADFEGIVEIVFDVVLLIVFMFIVGGIANGLGIYLHNRK